MTRLCTAVALLMLGLTGAVASQAADETPEVVYTAVSANVAEPGQPVRIRIFRWSSDRERSPILAALDPLPPPSEGRAAGARAAGRGGRAGGRGRGRAAEPVAPPTPGALLSGAIRRASSIGYVWTNAVTGYSIKYAVRTPLPEGGERVILATDRRFGEHAAGWQLAPGQLTEKAPADYAFTLFELRFDPKGVGEARTSLTSAVVVDKTAGTLALENYAAAPVILQRVRAASETPARRSARHADSETPLRRFARPGA